MSRIFQSIVMGVHCSTTRWLIGVQKDYRLRDSTTLSHGTFDSGAPYGTTLHIIEEELTRRGITFSPKTPTIEVES